MNHWLLFSRCLKIIVVVWIGLALLPLASPATAAAPRGDSAQQPQTADQPQYFINGAVLETYVGNTDAYLRIWIENGSPQLDRVRGELYQDNRLLARYDAVSAYNEWEHHAVGLATGSTVTFRLDISFWDTNTNKWQLVVSRGRTFVAGEVRGAITRDTTWSGGVWRLKDTVFIQDGAKLTIADGAIVELDPQPWLTNGYSLFYEPGGALEIENATLRNMIIGTDNALARAGAVRQHPAPLVIRNSTLDTTSIGSAIRSDCVSALVLENNQGSVASGLPPPSIQVCSDSPEKLVLHGNALPGYVVALDLSNGAGELTVAGNIFDDLSFGALHNGAIMTRLTVRNNTLHTLTIERQEAPLLVEGNTSGAIAINNSYHTGATVAGTESIQGILRNNTLSPAEYGRPGIVLAGASYIQVENNVITCQRRAGREYGLRLVPYLLAGAEHNLIFGNTILNCDIGINLYGYEQPVADNTIRDNVLIDNNSSMWVNYLVQNNLIYNNLFRQTNNLFPHPLNIDINSPVCQDAQGNPALCPNTWNIPKTVGANIVGGSFLGGNYYSEYTGADGDQDGLGDRPYALQPNNQDQHPLISPNAPDLFVYPLMLDARHITFGGGKYILPVAVTIANLGVQPASNVQVQWLDGSGQVGTRTIGDLAAGTATVLQLDWELNPTLLPGNGQALAALTIQADPANAIQEIIENNNTRMANISLDVRPRLLEIQPEYTLAGAYYLNNESVANRLKALVDWNGALPGAGAPPFGAVVFNLNGVSVAEAGQEWGAAHTYDMGSDFNAALQCANNLLRISVVLPLVGGELQSLETTLQPTVFPFPGWVQWAITNLPGADASFETRLAAPLVEYQYDFKYPEEPFEATWTPPAWIPYLGGAELGVQPTQGGFNLVGKSNGLGTVAAEGQTGLGLAALTAQGRVFGQGETRFVCGESLDLARAELGFSIQAAVEKEIGLTALIPAVSAAESWPVVGRIIRWVNKVATVKGSLTPAFSVLTLFEEQNDELAFLSGAGTGRLEARAELAVAPIADLNASVYGGGEPYLTLQTPPAPDYLKEVGINLFYGATFQAWSFETEAEHRINCQYPGVCQEAEPLQSRSTVEWRLIPRDYAGPTYAQFTPSQVQAAAIAGNATTLLTNIYPYPQPALALSNANRWLAYVQDDPADPPGRGAEIHLLTYGGGTWGAPAAITSDEQPDYAPAIAADGAGRGVLLWERAALPTGVTPALDTAFAQSLEIHACAWNGSACLAPTALTNDALMDYAPQLAPLANGDVQALWQTGDGADLLGTVAHPISLTTAMWQHAAATWSTPQTALAGLHDILSVAFAAYTGNQAAVVYARDMDGDLGAAADAELFYSMFDGTAWSAPVRLTNDTLADVSPSLAYDAAGRLHLVWRRDAGLAWLNNTWDINALQTLGAATEGGYLGFQFSRAANGNLALVWQAMGDSGPNLAYRVYDAANAGWGAPQLLLDDAATESACTPAFGADGQLYLAYQKTAVSHETRAGVPNVPVPGQSDLVFLVHTVGRDLAWDSFTVAPANPPPGVAVLLTAVLRNAGALTISAPQAAFYDDATLIGSVQTLPSLNAGYTATITVNWTLPAGSDLAHTLAAVGDPTGQVSEIDETNNLAILGVNLPDLFVDTFYTSVTEGQLAAIARLRNAGTGSALMPFTVTLRAGDVLTGALLAATQAPPLGAGESFTHTFILTDAAHLAGADAIWLLADSTAMIVESDEQNNAAVAAAAFLPDLTLGAEDIMMSDAPTVTIHNVGLLAAANVLVTVRDGGSTGTLHFSGSVPSIPAGGSAQLAFGLPDGILTLFVAADPLNAIAERDESNNLAVRLHAVQQEGRGLYLPLVQR